MYSWGQLVWRIWMAQAYQMGRFHNLLWETFKDLWLLGISSALVLFAQVPESDDDTAVRTTWLASPSWLPPLHCRLQRFPYQVLQDLSLFLNLQMQSVSLSKDEHVFQCSYIWTWDLFRLTHSDQNFAHISSEQSLSEIVIIKKKKKNSKAT